MTTFGERTKGIEYGSKKVIRDQWWQDPLIEMIISGTMAWGIIFTILFFTAKPIEIAAATIFAKVSEHQVASVLSGILMISMFLPIAIGIKKLFENLYKSRYDVPKDTEYEYVDEDEGEPAAFQNASGRFCIPMENGGTFYPGTMEKKILIKMGYMEWISLTKIKKELLQCNYETEAGPAIDKLIDHGLMESKINDRPGPGRKGNLFKLTKQGREVSTTLENNADIT